MKKNKANIIILIVFAVAFLVFLFSIDNPKNLWEAICSANPVYLGCAGLCMIGYWVLESLTLYSIANQMNNSLSLSESIKTSMVGQMFNCITPFASGGQPIQAYRLNRYGISVGKASCVLLAKFLVYQIVLTIYSLIMILLKFSFFLKEVARFEYLVLLGFGINFIVVLFLIAIGFFPSASRKTLHGLVFCLHKIKIIKDTDRILSKIDRELDAFYQDFVQLKGNLKILILPSLITVLQLTCFFTVPYFICLSLHVTGASYLTMISAAAFVLMISSFVPLPGGSGGAEGGFYLLFSMFFPSAGMIAITILLWRVMTFYLPILFGLFFSKMKVSSRNKKSDLRG